MSKQSGEIMAAITAALVSFETRPGHQLVVKSLRRVQNESYAWTTAGRIERLRNNLK